MEIHGTPADGDSFDIRRSASQSMFVTLENLIVALESQGDTPEERAVVNNAVNRAISEVDLANENVLSVRASVGARLNALDTEMDSIELASLDMETVHSELVDLDYAKAISEFNLKLTGLQAAQQSYVQIQGLSLFNFLR
jgi:flagellar hook-associated protein 3 FlgL